MWIISHPFRGMSVGKTPQGLTYQLHLFWANFVQLCISGQLFPEGKLLVGGEKTCDSSFSGLNHESLENDEKIQCYLMSHTFSVALGFCSISFNFWDFIFTMDGNKYETWLLYAKVTLGIFTIMTNDWMRITYYIYRASRRIAQDQFSTASMAKLWENCDSNPWVSRKLIRRTTGGYAMKIANCKHAFVII